MIRSFSRIANHLPMDSTMHRFRLLLLMAVLSIGLAVALQAAEKKSPKTETDDNGIVWYGYQDGWEKASAENKHMFVDFTATWCIWCKRLEKNTFSSPLVTKALNEDFVAVKVWEKSKTMVEIDGYKITEHDMAKKEFGVRGYPALWFVSPKGVRIGPAGGYVEAGVLLKYFDIVKNYRYDSTLDESGKPINKEDS